eukprot:217156_1
MPVTAPKTPPIGSRKDRKIQRTSDTMSPPPKRSWKETWEGQSETVFQAFILALICILSFCIRLFSVIRYESVIHEFDPWFNFRATKYLVKNGFYAFHNWFDDMTWYPLGRNIGGTTYPGLMWTAAILHKIAHFLNIPINIRNVCVFTAPFMSSLTSLSVYLLTMESWNSHAALMAASVAAVVPGYISRSVAGSYDNEAVAIFALVNTFYLWVKAVKTGSLLWSCLCALGYFYMVASWGGYIFIINLIPLHVFLCILAGRFSHRLYVAYSIFYSVGTLLSMQIQFVQFQPVSLDSVEHLPAMGIFVLVQLCEGYLIVRSLLTEKQQKQFFKAVLLFTVSVLGGLVALAALGFVPMLTGRFLALIGLGDHTIAIVKSVSEHQPTSWGTFFLDMHMLVLLVPVGLVVVYRKLTDANMFVCLYAILSSYFAGIMIRLVLVISPVACVFGGIALSELLRAAFGVFTRKKSSFIKKVSGAMLICMIGCTGIMYYRHCTWVTSAAYSSPSIILQAYQNDGSRVIFDDYREAYNWLNHNTPADAKIMSWWDYGYQITGMGNRTVLVDNNTRNNTHIATVGMAMASTEEDAYPILQAHHVDYVLAVFGGVIGYSSDDINKFLWMVRIGGGTYPRIVESEYFSSSGSYTMDRHASQTMRKSLMYKMCYYRFDEKFTVYGQPSGFDRVRGVEVGEKNIKLTHLEEAYTTEHWMVRIYRVKRPEELSRF